jgi:hypothetical protein
MALMLASTAPEPSNMALTGIYLCATEQRAAIKSDHRPGSGDPVAVADKSPLTRFKMEITRRNNPSQPYQAVELPYDGPDRDHRQWQDENSVLHSAYTGDTDLLQAVSGPAFFSIYGGLRNEFKFYHAGFEYPGGEDTQFAVRWGRCKKVE